MSDTYSTSKSAKLGAERALIKLGIEHPMRDVHFKLEETFEIFNGPTRWQWRQIDIWCSGAVLPLGKTLSAADGRRQRAAADAIAETEKQQSAGARQQLTIAEQTTCTNGTSCVGVSQDQASIRRGVTMTETQTETGNTKHRANSIVQNGVRRPSDATGACGVIWAELDRRAAAGETPTLSDMKAYGDMQNWKIGNTTSEFYNWRRFNGVKATPRAAKASKSKTNA